HQVDFGVWVAPVGRQNQWMTLNYQVHNTFDGANRMVYHQMVYDTTAALYHQVQPPYLTTEAYRYDPLGRRVWYRSIKGSACYNIEQSTGCQYSDPRDLGRLADPGRDPRTRRLGRHRRSAGERCAGLRWAELRRDCVRPRWPHRLADRNHQGHGHGRELGAADGRLSRHDRHGDLPVGAVSNNPVSLSAVERGLVRRYPLRQRAAEFLRHAHRGADRRVGLYVSAQSVS